MPSTTEKQARFMAACHHGAGYESCPPAKVSADFNEADKGTAMLSNAMKHRVKKAFGGPLNTGMQRMNPQIMAALASLRNRTIPNRPPTPVMGPAMTRTLSNLMNTRGTLAPWALPPATPNSQGMTSASAGPLGIPPQPSQPDIMPTLPPVSSLMPPQTPSGGALGTLRNSPGMMARPMPMPGSAGMGQNTMPNLPAYRGPINASSMMARGGGVQPPGMGPSPLPTSPLSSLIGGGMAAMHAGPGLAPHMRKPRIPLPGALRNINQTINSSRQRLGQMRP